MMHNTNLNLQINLQSAEHSIKLAAIWQAKQNMAQAAAHYEKAIQHHPNYIPAYLGLINLLVQMNQIKSAIEVCRQAIEHNPHETWLPVFLDDLMSQPGEVTEQSSQAELMIAQHRNLVLRQGERQRPHVLLYTNCPNTHGAEQISHALMGRLVAQGYQVTCVQSAANHHLIDARTKLGIEHIWLQDNAHKILYSVSNAPEVIEIMSQALPDLVIFADGDPTSNLAANWTAMRLGIPFIRIVHCVIPERATQLPAYLHLLPAIYQAAKAVIAVSQANLQLMRERFELPEHLGQVIYNGRPDQYFTAQNQEVRQRLRQSLGIPETAIVSFTAARMDLVKGYQHQLNAIAQLQQTPLWSQLYFVWAGTGSLEAKLKARVVEMGAEDHVKFLGERSDIADWLDAADLFVLTSHVEGMPLSVMEAMAKGLPVMATAISGVPEALGDCGKLLPDPTISPQATVQSLVDTLQLWAVDAQLRQTIGQACQQRAETLFREERMLDSYLKLIQQVLSD